MTKRKSFGLPSGDDAAAYGDARSKSAWRWEFLRRRPDYQDDWVTFHVEWQARRVSEQDGEPLPPGVTSWRKHFARIAELPGSAQRAKYGMAHLVDPGCAWSPWAFFGVFLDRVDQLRDAARKSVPAHMSGYEKRFERAHATMLAIGDALSSRDVITAYIDLLQPIQPQIDRLKEWATNAQAELSDKPAVSRLHLEKWPIYLRLLDLERRGLSFDAIAGHVYPAVPNGYPDHPARRRVEQALKQAHRLQDTFALGS